MKNVRDSQENTGERLLWTCQRVFPTSPADVIDGDVPQLFVHGRLALLATRVGADGGLGMLVGHVDLDLAASLKNQDREEERRVFVASRKNVATRKEARLTGGALAVVLVQLDQDRGGHHQEVPQRRGDRVGDHREAFAQATQALQAHKNAMVTSALSGGILGLPNDFSGNPNNSNLLAFKVVPSSQCLSLPK